MKFALLPQPIEILAEPGRFLVASAATAIAQIVGKAIRGGKLCYYIDDGVCHTFSGVIFDHCQYTLAPPRFALSSLRHATHSTPSA